MKKITLILISLLSILSCKKANDEFSTNSQIEIGELVMRYLKTQDIEFDGIVSIYSNKLGNKLDRSNTPTVMVDGKIYSDKINKISTNSGNLSVGDIEIPFRNSQETSGYNLQSLLTSDFTAKKLAGLFGRRVKIDIPRSYNSSVVMSFSNQNTNNDDNNFYIPSQIEMDPGPNNDFTLPRSEVITVYWNPDPQNPSNSIFVGVIDEKNSDQFKIGSLQELIFFKEIPDNGSFSLPRDLLSRISADHKVSLFVARGNFEILTDESSSSSILVQALTTSSIPFMGIR